MNRVLATVLLVFLVGASSTFGAFIKLRLDPSSSRFSRAADSCSDLVPADKSTLVVPIANASAPWSNKDVDVWKSSCMTTKANKLLDETVACIEPATTFRKLFTTFHEENCWIFMWGGIVRDMILGSAPNDVDSETSCDLPRLVEVCNKYYGKQCWSSGSSILHIGGSIDTDTFVDVASWDQTMFGDGTALEYSTNAMAYDWLQHTTLDFSYHFGPSDTQKMLVRMPVLREKWDAWADYGSDKTFRFWKLLLKNYSPADNETFDYSADRFRNLTTSDAGKLTLQRDYCKYALAGKFETSGKVCKTEADCSKINGYDTRLRNDFGAELWNNELQQLFKTQITCVLTPYKTCIKSASSTIRVTSYSLLLVAWMVISTKIWCQ